MEKVLNTNNIRLVGHLLKYTKGYKKFVGYKTEGPYIIYEFINELGFPRYFGTKKTYIRNYCFYTSNDIEQTLLKGDF